MLCKEIVILLLLTLVGRVAEAQTHNDDDKGADKPNVIIIYTDQQRFNSIQALGNPHIHTPNLDRLAREGIAFTQTFVTAPVCVASRTSLLSGMYHTRLQTYSNHHIGHRPTTSLPLALREKGYFTSVLGKNHSFLDTQDVEQFVPTAPFEKHPEDGRSAGKKMPWSAEEDPTRLLTNAAMHLLDSVLLQPDPQDRQPMFMWLSYFYPHTPYLAPEPYFSMYDTVNIPAPAIEPEGLADANKPFRQVFHQDNTNRLLPYDEEKVMRMRRTYYGMVSFVDDEIGRLLDYLEENQLRENTIILFTSDHGDYMGDHGMMTKSPAMYDCLTRVPFLMSWPGHIPTAQKYDGVVSQIDIMPTILDLLNVKVPKRVQGKSFTGVLRGDTDQPYRQYAFATYGLPGRKPVASFAEINELMPHYESNPVNWAPGIPWEGNPISLAGTFQMVRSKDWKLVYEAGGTSELYDMVNDPHELTNLYGQAAYEEIQGTLSEALASWKEEHTDDSNTANNLAQENLNRYLKFRQAGKSPTGMYK